MVRILGSTICEHIISQIPRVILGYLQELHSDDAVRILGDTPNGVLDPHELFKSIHPFVSKVQHCVRGYRTDYDTRFVAVNICPGRHSYFVVDVNNVDYNTTAHECKAPIPVYVLRLPKRTPSIRRAVVLYMRVAEVIANMHNGHGQDHLPLVDDYNDPNLCYPNLRSLRS
ncbi:hypothetical protein BDW62DRAFT_214517 [Aspergillus aurantiobrunneus]